MSDYLFAPAPQPALEIEGSDKLFPIRRIYCVGRNYAEHAREMGNDPEREPPFFFTKPASAYLPSGPLPYPPATQNLHHEAELVVALHKGGRDLSPEAAGDLIFGYACGNDLTRRDLQNEAKSLRRPWDMSKGFDNSAVIGALRAGPLSDGVIRCRVNGETRQEARLSDMIWDVASVISSLSRLVTLYPGDLIMTGTPAGVGALTIGDLCRVEIEGLRAIESRITA